MKKYIVLLSFVLTLFLISCNTNDDNSIPSISFSTNELILKTNQELTLPIDLAGISNDDIIFTCNNEEIAFIDGVTIEGLKVGYTTITAKHKKTDTVLSTIDVIVEAENVKTPVLTTTTSYISVDRTTALMFSNKDEVGASLNSFNWTISDNKIATISNDLIVTGLKEGKVTITATLKSDPTVVSSFELTVTNVNNSDDRLLLYTTDPTATVQAGEYIEVFIEGKNKNDFYFKSYNNQIALAAENGRIAGFKEGVAKIAAFSKTTNEIYGSIYVTVTGTPNVDYAKRIVDVALSQEGYIEGTNNDTKYGYWYGMNNNEWCAMFVSWAANEAGVTTTVIPKFALVSAGKEWFERIGQFKYKGSYTPKAGDIIFFLSNGASHTAIVTGSDGEKVYTIEGNTSNKVAQRQYLLTNSTITGYGIPIYPTYNG